MHVHLRPSLGARLTSPHPLFSVPRGIPTGVIDQDRMEGDYRFPVLW